MTNPLIEPAYHIYCDEFGDHSLKRSASEFFIVSAVVVATKRDPLLPQWIARIREPMRGKQRPDLHFASLDDRMKRRAAHFVSKMPLRCFTLVSHKQNMIDYRNRRCEERYGWRTYFANGEEYVIDPRTTSYPNFVLKVLLERATAWCLTRSYREHGEPRPVSITIAKRGGFYLSEFKAYLVLDHRNYAAQSGVLPHYLAWPVIDMDRIVTAPAANVAGLQLADVVTGAFSRAVDEKRFGKCDRECALWVVPQVFSDDP